MKKRLKFIRDLLPNKTNIIWNTLSRARADALEYINKKKRVSGPKFEPKHTKSVHSGWRYHNTTNRQQLRDQRYK